MSSNLNHRALFRVRISSQHCTTGGKLGLRGEVFLVAPSFLKEIKINK